MTRTGYLLLGLVGFTALCSGVPMDGAGFDTVSRQTCPLRGIFPDGAEGFLGCHTIQDLQGELRNAIGDIVLGSSDPAIGAVLNMIARSAVNQLADFMVSSHPVADNYWKSPICLGDFDGSEIETEPDLITSGCEVLPLGYDENWTMIAFNLPVITPICPQVKPGSKMSMCLAFSLDCNNTPSFSIALNKGLISCFLGSTAAVSSTAGISAALSKASEVALDQVAAGLSMSNAFTATAKLFTGENGVEEANVQGTYHDRVSVKISPKTFKLPNWVSLGGFLERVVNVKGSRQSFSNSIGAFKIGSSAGDDILSIVSHFDISVLIHGQISMSLQLKKVTRGILPDIPEQQLAEFSAFATTYNQVTAKGTTLLPGFYLSANASFGSVEVIKSIGKNILKAVEAIIEYADWFGALNLPTSNLSNILDGLDEGDTPSLEFGLLVNTEEVQIMIGAGITAQISFTLHFRYNYDNASASCRVKVGGVDKFFTAKIKEVAGKVVWVVNEAGDFFEDTGDVIAASIYDASGEVEAFGRTAIQETAQFFTDMGSSVEREIATWANSAVLMCGSKLITDGTRCGLATIVDGSKCGFRTVTSASNCGSIVVTSAAKCGTRIVRDGAICGWDTITDGAVCGFETIGTCFITFFQKCKAAKSCRVPRSCSIAATCSIPNTCQIEARCSVAKTCSVPTSC
ncbi:hypothetical protein NDN08_002118 [Rhodosorus marinus]|uniref:Lipid-binding serum glycoprotein C-terminal domain-containing protein n=1 Tax=Rhodosorus marinus TaxID=101924 RepID=A0AAV8UWG9_9RHOD|nr:hypothetical protein NDN08_002118 [Rhodosorus marinus]